MSRRAWQYEIHVPAGEMAWSTSGWAVPITRPSMLTALAVALAAEVGALEPSGFAATPAEAHAVITRESSPAVVRRIAQETVERARSSRRGPSQRLCAPVRARIAAEHAGGATWASPMDRSIFPSDA